MDNPFLLFSIALGAFILSILLMRAIFSVDKHLKNQKAIIALLIKQCRAAGVPESEIEEVKSKYLG